MKRVVGLDLSLTATGVGTSTATFRIKPKSKGYPRLRYIKEAVLDYVRDCDLVVVEGPSFGSQGSSAHQIAGLWWYITEAIERDHRMAVASPSTIKKYATGSGTADKDRMLLSAARRFSWFEGDNNEADALWACALGHHWLDEPLVSLPEPNLMALAGVEWPDV